MGLGPQERAERGQARHGRDEVVEEVPAAVEVREAGQGGGGGTVVVRIPRYTAGKATALGCDRRF